MAPPRIGELLVAEGLLTPAAVNRALGFQRAAAPRVRLGSILLTWDLIDEGNLLKALAALHRCEAVTGEMLSNAPVDVVRLLPAPHAIRLNAIPYALARSRVRVAFVNPSDIGAIDEVSSLTGHICVPGVVTELRLLQAHRRFYGRVIPHELRPVMPRAEPARPARPAGGEPPAPAPPKAIPVAGKPAASGSAGEPAPITVPDLPLPSPPSPFRREAVTPQGVPSAPAAGAVDPSAAAAVSRQLSDTEQKASAMWIATPPMPPESETVRGMWSHSAAPPPVSEEEVGDLALASVPGEIPRAILLSDRNGVLVGWRARGLDTESLQAIRIPGAEPSVFAAVARSGAPHFGRVEPELWPESLARLFDGPPPCAVFPIHAGHGVAALLYADRRGAPMKFEDTALLARAAAEIAALLARVRLGEPR
jgi:MshEN domain